MAPLPLLAPDEPKPVSLRRPHGRSEFLLTADHAGRLIPRALGTLGLTTRERTRHVAWDIGIAGVTRRISTSLDATALLQRYSRLVIDCNRPPDVPSAFPEISDGTTVPANAALSAAEKERRCRAIFEPYHAAIASILARRRQAGQPTIYVAMHSFTPVFGGEVRKMHCAVLYNRHPRLSLVLAQILRADGDLIVAENAPYRVSDATDYGVPVHAEAAGLDYLEIEIRQDLISRPAGQAAWAARLARLLPVAADRISGDRP